MHIYLYPEHADRCRGTFATACGTRAPRKNLTVAIEADSCPECIQFAEFRNAFNRRAGKPDAYTDNRRPAT